MNFVFSTQCKLWLQFALRLFIIFDMSTQEGMANTAAYIQTAT